MGTRINVLFLWPTNTEEQNKAKDFS